MGAFVPQQKMARRKFQGIQRQEQGFANIKALLLLYVYLANKLQEGFASLFGTHPAGVCILVVIGPCLKVGNDRSLQRDVTGNGQPGDVTASDR